MHRRDRCSDISRSDSARTWGVVALTLIVVAALCRKEKGPGLRFDVYVLELRNPVMQIGTTNWSDDWSRRPTHGVFHKTCMINCVHQVDAWEGSARPEWLGCAHVSRVRTCGAISRMRDNGSTSVEEFRLCSDSSEIPVHLSAAVDNWRWSPFLSGTACLDRTKGKYFLHSQPPLQTNQRKPLIFVWYRGFMTDYISLLSFLNIFKCTLLSSL